MSTQKRSRTNLIAAITSIPVGIGNIIASWDREEWWGPALIFSGGLLVVIGSAVLIHRLVTGPSAPTDD